MFDRTLIGSGANGLGIQEYGGLDIFNLKLQCKCLEIKFKVVIGKKLQRDFCVRIDKNKKFAKNCI